jgi:hypothetical protein
MATIIATPGDSSANSYASIVEADLFLLEKRVGASAWDSVADKTAALIMATIQLERFPWIGSRASSDQSLSWPRTGAYGPDGVLIPSDELPAGLVRATIEMAFWLTQGDRTAIPGGQTLEQLKAGPIDLKFRDPAGTGGMLDAIPDIVSGHLTGLTTSSISGGSGFRNVAVV